jgi:hypothetical protein
MIYIPVTAKKNNCANLDTNEKVHKYIIDTMQLNPITKDNSSMSLEIKTKQKRTRTAKDIHMIRNGENKRIFFTSGEFYPKCLISKGDKNYRCGECTYSTNSFCREQKDERSGTKVAGTNIDLDDFDISHIKDYTSKCSPIRRRRNYIQIESINTGEKRKYNKIVSIFEIKRNLPIVRNFYEGKTLKKVYRFFPKDYKKVNNQWMATVMRVRSVNGKERKYEFETIVKIKRNSKYKYLFYDKIEKDTLLEGASVDSLFKVD